MKQRQKWVRLPSKWINEGEGLKALRYQGNLADNIMALMCLVVIAHEVEQETGQARITYDQFETALGKSRSLISRGLRVLQEMELIDRNGKRSEYQLCNFNPTEASINDSFRWAKLPCASLYRRTTLTFFDNMSLRGRAELDALKLFFLFAALRDRTRNIAMISYDNIPDKTGVGREHIKRALSLLSVNGIVLVEHIPTEASYYGFAHGYRLIGIDSHTHAGNSIRGMAGSEAINILSSKTDF